jgi:hypothetical protein
VLPPGRDLSLAVEDPFASDQDQFLEPFDTPAPARSAEIASPKQIVTEESKTIAPQDPISAPSAVPKPPPPVTITVPRTLRPITTPNVPVPARNEPLREQPASTTIEEPTPIVLATDAKVREVKQSISSKTETMPPPLAVAGPTEEHQEPIPRPVQTEIVDTTPIPRVDNPSGLSVVEPAPPPGMPVHLPAVASNNITRPEQSQISIGSLEVLVNNHPKVTPSRPAPAPSRTERLNLEKHYLDRFRLRH